VTAASPREKPGLSPQNIGRENTILWGKAHTHHVSNFPGPLSIKFVIRGSAVWQTDDARWVVGPGIYLILNDGCTYSIRVDSTELVETFCLFFKPGFVEDIWRSAVTRTDTLLDSPDASAAPVNFFERMQPPDRVTSLLRRVHTQCSSGSLSEDSRADAFIEVAREMLETQRSLGREVAKIPAAKASTRQELLCRVSRGRDFIESSWSENITLEEIARAACLSPYHFHRVFLEAFGERPHEYLVRRRLERAAEMLRGSDLPVTDVCLEAGFESPGTFSTLFKRRYGMPPSRWRAASD
jgi:AraC-like DNA-binding protein